VSLFYEVRHYTDVTFVLTYLLGRKPVAVGGANRSYADVIIWFRRCDVINNAIDPARKCQRSVWHQVAWTSCEFYS